jgi:DmsE family decaheme c-type cytochrome
MVQGGQTVRPFTPVNRSTWMRSAGLALIGLLLLATSACQSPHQPTRRTDPNLDPGWPQGNRFYHQASYPAQNATIPTVEGAEMVNDDELCSACHETYTKTFENNVHRGDNCESCHGPASKHVETRGKEPGMIFSFKTGDPTVRAEACLKCHENNQCTEGTRWRTSRHAASGTTCVDCHRGHYNVPPGTRPTTEPGGAAREGSGSSARLAGYAEAADAAAKESAKEPAKDSAPRVKDSTKGGKLPSLKGTSTHLGAVAPGICFRCHSDYEEYAKVAGPHQICGSNGFNCTTCHDAHGQVIPATRKELCLECHQDAPTMAYHSSTHDQSGVACTDCHNPHPRIRGQRIVNVSHTNIVRPQRRPMSVQEPEACYKCHPKIYGQTQMPSHHPIQEGKMVCSDCHDAHGQETGNLKEASVNLLCYKCHAEKQGPFAFEHPPVREDCGICHNPHGAVANNLLKQPAAFLCLRCHPGHYAQHRHGGINLRIDTDPTLRQPFYTDCSQCHQQIHGTDRISELGSGFFTR